MIQIEKNIQKKIDKSYINIDNLRIWKMIYNNEC